MLGELLETGSDRHPDLPSPADVVVAAVPLFGTAGDTDTDADADLGWLALLERTDELACRCVREALDRAGGATLPFGAARTITTTTPTGAEWARGLTAAPRTAAVEVVACTHDDHREGLVEVLADSASRAPVARRADGHPTAAVPRRLFTASPLAELILDASHTIWVRCGDQTVYLAPQ